MLRKTFLLRRSTVLVLLSLGVLVGWARAQTETVLYNFCEQSNCADGEHLLGGLAFDQNGNLYGTTYSGGAYDHCGQFNYGCGVVFKLTPKGKETVLYSFCALANCTDGAQPPAGVVFDQKGNLYGTTNGGGDHGAGVIFKITPKGRETVLYSFCAKNNCTDGNNPLAGLIFDQKGNLYGTTQYGGAYGAGAVFKLTPEGKETVLHSFCQEGYPCTDGALPQAGLVFDQKGNLYGTTQYGGTYNSNVCGNVYEYGCGVVFKLTPKGRATALYTFCAQSGCTDGAEPRAGLVFDQKGNLYGTTINGGLPSNYSCGNIPGTCGVVFKLTPEGKETVLYSFCAQTNCADGANPQAGVVLDRKGNLYGTTVDGGNYYGCKYGCGTVFKLTPEGKETVLHTYCTQNTCTDGAEPVSGLLFDRQWNLYGTTVDGGMTSYCTYGCGVVFKLTP